MPFPQPPLPFPPFSPSEFLPVGTVVAFAGIIEDEVLANWGWMVCDGRQLNAAQYPELFSVVKYLYIKCGEQQEEQFRIPDYRGYFLRGMDPQQTIDQDKRKLSDGSEDKGIGSIQQDALQAHGHTYMPTEMQPGPTGGLGDVQNQKKTGLPTAANEFVPPPPKSEVRVSEYETRPKNIAVNYIIKFTSFAQWRIR